MSIPRSFADVFPLDTADNRRNAIMAARLIDNVLASRQQWIKNLLSSRRDLDATCDYPKNPDAWYYQELASRDAVAARVYQVMPRESWQVQPSVYEKESAKVQTEFEKAWKNLGRSLRGKGYFVQEEGSPIWEILGRADELSGLGQYGVILLGLDDIGSYGIDSFEKPVAGVEETGSSPGMAGTDGVLQTYQLAINAEKTRGRKLLYTRVFTEAQAPITRFETNRNSPRYGEPVMYRLTFNDTPSQIAGATVPQSSLNVHWTRVIHLADNRQSSEVFGMPRLQPVLNRVLDVRKLYAGSAEMYWKGAFPGYSLEPLAGSVGGLDMDADSIKDVFEQWENGLKRYVAWENLTMRSLAPQVVDPSPQIDVQIAAICIQLGIPKRVFMGSERGELASSQDDAAWNDRLRHRQNAYISPLVIAPLVDRLIQVGVLPEPADGYRIEWPSLDSQSGEERARIAQLEAQAIAAYQGGMGQLIVPKEFFLSDVLRKSPERVQMMLKAIEEEKKQQMQDAEDTLKMQAEVHAQTQAQTQPQAQPGAAAAPAKPKNANQIAFDQPDGRKAA